jgi:D-tyrosyl-tRNA(Tyr) deacylase
MSMGSQMPLTWLVVTTAPAWNGQETALLARASYDASRDVLTVKGPGGQQDAERVGSRPVQPLAKLMLRQMFSREEGSA